jgi:hypothetical protein
MSSFVIDGEDIEYLKIQKVLKEVPKMPFLTGFPGIKSNKSLCTLDMGLI